MGVLTLGAISVAGSYSAIPSNPITTSTNGSGTGCTLNATYGLLAPTLLTGGTGYDSTSAFVVGGSGGGSISIVLGASTNGLISLLNTPAQNDIVALDSVNFLTQSY